MRGKRGKVNGLGNADVELTLRAAEARKIISANPALPRPERLELLVAVVWPESSVWAHLDKGGS